MVAEWFAYYLWIVSWIKSSFNNLVKKGENVYTFTLPEQIHASEIFDVVLTYFINKHIKFLQIFWSMWELLYFSAILSMGSRFT
jgi:hypothetical protein